jgi:hypothetical protein
VFNFILKIFCSSCRRSSAKKQDMLGKWNIFNFVPIL